MFNNVPVLGYTSDSKSVKLSVDMVFQQTLEFVALTMPLADPAHDLGHVTRVVKIARYLSRKEGADELIVIPAALMHDLVQYQKNDIRSRQATEESATLAGEFLGGLEGYPKDMICQVEYAILVCSFTRGIIPITLEARILKDADLLEQSGAISLMRTFASCALMRRDLIYMKDPFCHERSADPKISGLDLVLSRLLKIGDHLSTTTAKTLLQTRETFLRTFLTQLERELTETDLIK